MRIASAVLCDYAKVRNGLLTIVSAGITRLWLENLPSPLGVTLALVIELSPSERSVPHQLTVRVFSPTGTTIATTDGAFQVIDQSAFDSDEGALVPLALDLRRAQVDAFGWVRMAVLVDGDEMGAVRVKAMKRPASVASALTSAGRPKTH